MHCQPHQPGLTPGWDPALLEALGWPSLGRAAQTDHRKGIWSLRFWSKIKICSKNQPTTLWRRRSKGLAQPDPYRPFQPKPFLILCLAHPTGHSGTGTPRTPTLCPWHRAVVTALLPQHRWQQHKGEKKGEKSQINKKKPICKYCKECMFSYMLLLSPFVSYQQTSCQLGEVPTYFFFPVKCFSMPERIKMNVNEVY